MSTDLKSLISKLNTVCHGAMESAAGLCISRGHYEVDVEHFIMKLLEADNTDLYKILRHYGIEPSRFERDLNTALDGFKTGNTRNPVLSGNLPKLFAKAWLQASVNHGETRIRSGHIVLAILADKELSQLVKQWSRDLGAISFDDLARNLDTITSESKEAATAMSLGSGSSASDHSGTARKGGKTPALDQYTVNLTEKARKNLMDPVLGRDHEIRQMIDILIRRRQNNPILTGEAGVGKTAVVEGLAQRIVQNDVPPALQNVELHMLDLGLLQAGASVKGEFENRLRSVIEETKASVKPIIMFIDEAHTMIGAGGQAGQNDAANLLKPALARGELRTIAATTWSEYKKYFEKDPALTRRFQVVKVDEPTEEVAIIMLRGLLEKMQQHHNVKVLDEALISAVKLSHRYITGRQLPDKAVSVLDTSCARIAIGQSATPAPVEDTRRRIESLTAEIHVLSKEVACGAGHDERIHELTAQKQEAEQQLVGLEARWQEEKELVNAIRTVRDQLEEDSESAEPGKQRPVLLDELNRLTNQLEGLQGNDPLVQVSVDEQTVGAVISAWTGIPLGKMVKDELATVMNLKHLMGERVIGQDHALDVIAQRIRISRAGLEDPGKPIGVFMLVGTSGVGKTETALALADILYGGERNLITINMSEFQEAHTVSSLKGSPPGYVGYGEGGVLTEAVRRKPYSVVLLDEVEKAHPDVLELFFQVFDKGLMDDAEGREINFKNTVIILTSNVGTDTIMDACRDTVMPSVDALLAQLTDDLRNVFKPAFLGRLQVVPYYPVKDEILKQIVRLKLNKIKKRVANNHNASFDYDDTLVDAIAARCTEVDSGARNIDNIVSGNLLPEIAEAVLARLATGCRVEHIQISVAEDGNFAYQIS